MSLDPRSSAQSEPCVSAYLYADARPTVLVDPSGAVGERALSLDLPLGTLGYGVFRGAGALRTLSQIWRWSADPSVRSAASRRIGRAGRISRFATSPAFRSVGRTAPYAAGLTDLALGLRAGESPYEAGAGAARGTAGSEVGALAGGWACGLETVATAGWGGAACVAIVMGTTAGGGYLGQQFGGLIYKAVSWVAVSALDWTVVGLMTAVAVVGTTQWPKLWRNRSRAWDRPQLWWFWSDALWRGWVRAMPVGLVGFWLLIAGFVTLSQLPDDLDSKPKAQVLTYAIPGLILAALFVTCVLLTISVALFNWPKRVVPPNLRDQPGTLEEWRQERAVGRPSRANRRKSPAEVRKRTK